MSSLYERLARAEQLLEVEMDTVEILDPRGDEEVAIGTKDLNGCSTIVIIDKGIILAHIAPMGPEDGKTKTSTGFPHFMAKAKAAVQLMRNNEALFRRSTTTWGIFARLGEDTPLDHYATWLYKLFEHLGYPTQLAYYDVDPSDRRERKLPIGSVIVVTKGSERKLFLEDREQQPRAQQIQATATQVQASGSTHAIASGATPIWFGPGSSTATISRASAVPNPMAASVNQTTGVVWIYDGSKYSKMHGRTVLEQQSTPPVNEPFLYRGRYMSWDGTNRWISDIRGQWTRI